LKEKIKVYPEKQGVSIRSSTWSLWIRKVKTKEKGEVMFVLKPLETHYNPEKQTFSYTDLKGPIWLNKEELDNLITVLIQLAERTSNRS